MTRFSFLFLLVLSITASAQFRYVIDQRIPVQDGSGAFLKMPWAGGLNATQYNTLDLNNNQINDLVLFDRMANKIITFLRDADRYVYAPEYETFFPEGLLNWVLLRDYNCDGKKDLFTGDNAGMRVYKNTTTAGNTPSWEQVFFYQGPQSAKSHVLLTKGFTTKVNLQLLFDDLPSIADADGDGDLDIFCMQFAGSNIEFHQNFSKELYGTCDSLEFVRSTPREWGNVRECTCGEFAFHGDDCLSGGRVKHAGGKSLLALDVNQDQQADMLFSEATCDKLFLLPNEGTLTAPVINTFSEFPPITPSVSPVLYPAPYYEDVDTDGVKDLIISSNMFSRPEGELALDLSHSSRFYRNTGSNTVPVFQFVQDDFLQKGMIDVGDNAVPAFGDMEGDGDQDLFISRYTSPQQASTIVVYENVGTSYTPAFRLLTEDYLNFSMSNFFNLKLQLIDVNNDKTHDFVFTATDITSGVTDLYYISNKSETTLDFSGQPIVSIDFTLSLNENLHLTDVDANGSIDILAGRSDGSLEYWRNSGNNTTLSFTLQDPGFIGLIPSMFRTNMACTTADLNGDGPIDLVYGDQTGVLKIISNYRNASDNPGEKTEIVFNPLLGKYAAQNLGGRIWPTAARIVDTDKPYLIVGNGLGGVHVLVNDSQVLSPGIYPNPVSRGDLLQMEVDERTTLYIYSITGARIAGPVVLEGGDSIPLRVPWLAQGLYIFRFVSGRKTFTQKIMIK